MDTNTHKKLTTSFLKSAGVSANKKMIDSINWDIDNSPGYVLALGQYMNRNKKKAQQANPFIKDPADMFGIMGGGGHRAYGHSMLSGMLIGMRNARMYGLPASKGMLPVLAHYAADSMSNRMVNRMGVEGRNLFEAMFNWQTRRNKNSSFRF